MGVDDVGAGQRAGQAGGDRVGGMAELPGRTEQAQAQAARLASDAGPGGEAHELGVDVRRERPRQLERVALATPEDAARPERGRGDVHDAHLVVSLITLGDPRRLTGGYLYHLRMAEAAPEHGARVVFQSFPERPFPLAASSARAVLARARAAGADVLLLDSIAAAFAAPWLALRPPGLPLIGTLHQPPGGIDHGTFRTRLQTPLDRLAYRRARLLLAASEHLAEQLVAQGVPDERIRVVPPGRDVAAAPAGPALDLRGGRGAAFLCVANWVERKGILELLDAFAALAPTAATLHLAGDEQAEPRYGARVGERLGRPDLAGRVVRHGRLSTAAVAALYAAADVFVLPAFREPYGTVWGEAMAFGLPVVGWRAGNLPYLADHGAEALMAPPGDVAALSRALASLAAEEPLRRRLGEAARARALARPTWDESAAAFFAAIRSAAYGAHT
jgi:glycosyltransferase involved in cell wall biosynthesis